jgi:hypothetical protein
MRGIGAAHFELVLKESFGTAAGFQGTTIIERCAGGLF